MIDEKWKHGWLVFVLLTACGSGDNKADEGTSGLDAGIVYTAANAHSHNDYEQDKPFEQAYQAGFGSMEADIFLRGGELFVAHDAEDIRAERTLEALYLKPIAAMAGSRSLQLLIDLKTHADSTLPVLVEQLARYPALVAEAKGEKPVKVVISGSRPSPERWVDMPAFISFDGRPGESYSPEALERTGLISDSFRKYTDWTGSQPLDVRTKEQLRQVVETAHKQGKPFRFWAVPDTPAAWELMTELGVDYINTDRIEALAAWLENRG